MAILLISALLLSTLPAVEGVEGKIKVVATLQIFSTFAKEIGGEGVDVDFIVPQGMDIHSYSLTYEDIEKLENADLIILASSEFFSLDKNIKEKVSGKDMLDFEDYNATLYPLGNFEVNMHGYWLYPPNALNIGKAIEEKLVEMDPANTNYYRNNFDRFYREVESTLNIIREIKEETKLEEKRALLAVPGVFYIVKMLDIPVAGTIVKGPNQFISSQELEEIKEEIRKGSIEYIVNAQGLEKSKAGEIAIQLSQETGVKIVYIDIFSAENYTTLILKDTVALGGAKYVNIYPSIECNYLPYLLTILALIAIASLVSYAAYYYRRELLK